MAPAEDGANFDARFDTVRHLGDGASGRVYLVSRRSDSFKFVRKKIPVARLKDAGMSPVGRPGRPWSHAALPCRRLRAGEVMREVHLLSQLQHPNITRYYGSWHDQANGCLNILMEYADGGSLDEVLKLRVTLSPGKTGAQDAERNYLDEDVVMDWFVQIVAAVRCMHTRRILHRDLKAKNVLLTSRGIIKVCDFGIAKVLEDTSGGTPGFARSCIGTPYYLSPEIVEDRPYSFPTDIWSLGILLYEMAALRKPFEASSLSALALRIANGTYPDIPSHYSADLQALVAKLLARDATARPTVEEVAADA